MSARRHAIPPAFGRRLQREREARHWSMREAAAECGVSPSTIQRAEIGRDIALSHAIQLAATYSVPLSALLAEPSCQTCDGIPPAGFICAECGRGAAGPSEPS